MSHLCRLFVPRCPPPRSCCTLTRSTKSFIWYETHVARFPAEGPSFLSLRVHFYYPDFCYFHFALPQSSRGNPVCMGFELFLRLTVAQCFKSSNLVHRPFLLSPPQKKMLPVVPLKKFCPRYKYFCAILKYTE